MLGSSTASPWRDIIIERRMLDSVLVTGSRQTDLWFPNERLTISSGTQHALRDSPFHGSYSGLSNLDTANRLTVVKSPNVEKSISDYIASQPEPKRSEMKSLHELVLQALPRSRLWFNDGKNDEGKVIANPNIGYGCYSIKYADGTTREFYQIGLSANKTGISVYILGIDDKNALAEKFGKSIGKASVTGYCIKFKSIKDIDLDVVVSAIKFGYETTSALK